MRQFFPLRAALVTSVAGAVLLSGGLTGCESAPRQTTGTGQQSTARPAPSSGTAPEPTSTTAQPTLDTRCGSPRASYAPGPGALPAPGKMPRGSTMEQIQRRGRLVAGVSADTLLFGYRNPISGQIEGFDVDLLKAVSRAIFGDGRAIQYRVLPSDERIPVLKSGEVDIVAATLTATCERWRQISFSSVYFEAGQRVLVAKGSTVKNLSQMAGQKVCVTRTSTSLKTLGAHPRIEVVQVAHLSDCLALFQQGKVDGVTSDDTVLAGFVAQDPHAVVIGPKMTEEPYALGMSAKQKDLVGFVNAVLEQVREDGTWKASYRRWIGDRLNTAGAGGTTGTPTPPQPLYGR
ncbi:MAG: polar amino acid transport system substrate-binding protein [Actinomycetota bacterium]|nr:polar amino acid transport system substrate-binding protein [Actinomycetota bacterium]